MGTQVPEPLVADSREEKVRQKQSAPPTCVSSMCLSPTGVEVGPWDGVFCSAKREVGPLQAGMSKRWCVSSTLSWQDTEDPGEDWRPWRRQSHHIGRAPTPDHHEDSCPPKR